MAKCIRSTKNPILAPEADHPWEIEAAFNGCPVKSGSTTHLVYRALSSLILHHGATLHVSSIGYASSKNGGAFKNRRAFISPAETWEAFGCEDPRVTKFEGKYYITYTALSTFPFSPQGIRVAVATTKDFKTVDEKHLVTPFNAKAMAVFPERIGGRMAVVLTANTDLPPSKIGVAFFNEPKDLWSKQAYWKEWYANLDKQTIPLLRSPQDQIEIGAPPIKTPYGWLLIYSYIKNYMNSLRTFGTEAALLDLKDPRKIMGRTSEPLFVPEEEYELYGNVPKIVFPSGALLERDKLSIYYGAADTTCCVATCSLKELLHEVRPTFTSLLRRASKPVKFIRCKDNPVIEPNKEHEWEAKATFNPGALYLNGRTHLVYRAMSNDNTSVIGYASGHDGFHFDERLTYPAYIPREKFERKSAQGNSGCEDPRLTKIGNKVYMLYTAFDGVNPPRVALTSIKATDFVHKRWQWERPMLISPPGIDDKDAALFPKKLHGKYAFLHRIGVGICLDFARSLRFKKDQWLGAAVILEPRPGKWDGRKIGIAAPPIETKDGWLLLYHGISEQNHVYRMGATLLKKSNPKKVIARIDYPLFEPEMRYEKEGLVENVVFPCGAAVIKNDLYIYYGGADEVVGVASTNLAALLKELKRFRIK